MAVLGDNTSFLQDRQSDAVTDYAAGNLSPAKHALMACALELNPDLAEAAAFETHIAASLMSEMRPSTLSPFLIGETLAKLPAPHPAQLAANDMEVELPLSTKPLENLLKQKSLQALKWKSVLPGIAVHNLLSSRKSRGRERLYLFRAKGGMQMPEHSHVGEEWTLILSGSYVSDDIRYSRGNLHIADETIEHAPRAEEGEDCICLVVMRGPPVMKSFFPKILQKVVGV